MNSFRFLIDAQLPPRLAIALTEKGYLAEHLENLGLRHAQDAVVWDYALHHNAVILTKDEDLWNVSDVDRMARSLFGCVWGTLPTQLY